jgi:putative molybdopterin biosynthesis protein
MAGGHGCYLVNLLQRSQGLIFNRDRHPRLKDLKGVAEQNLRFAERQELSGTYRLVKRLLSEQQIPLSSIQSVGPYTTHLELALAVQAGQADCGVGIEVVAEAFGLDFIPLANEPYRLAVPAAYISHPQISGFLEFVLGELDTSSSRATAGYGFSDTGLMEIIGRRDREESSRNRP